MTAHGETRWQKFPPETLRRLFDAVNVDDVVDAPAPLPDPIVLEASEDSMRRCYALCLQFWEDGVARADLLRLVHKLLRNEGWTVDERLQYKHIRARYKHLRFAQRLYSKSHTCDRLFDRTTRVLGHLQDAFRSGRRSSIVYYGIKLRLLLTKPFWAKVVHAVEHIDLDTAEGLLAYRRAEMHRLKDALAHAMFAGHEFHMVRKVVSMHVSYYDTLRSLDPSEDAYRMSRFLAAINGLMGSRHDEMVADSLSGRRSYETPAPLANETRWRLETLVARYPM
jgi:hypothetical protein